MTREERAYWYKQLKKMFEEWVATTTPENISSDLSYFEDKHMQTITGQQPLPQDVFRVFLREYVPIVTRWSNKQDKFDDDLISEEKSLVLVINMLLEENAALKSELEETKKLAYAGL